MTCRYNPYPVGPLTAVPSTVAHVQLAMPRHQARQQFAHGFGSSVDLTDVPNLPAPARFGHRHRVLRLGRVYPHENQAAISCTMASIARRVASGAKPA
jgi:hypothetical protein